MSEKVMCVFECDAVPDKTFKITNVNLKQCHGKLHIRVALEMKDSKIASPDCVEDTYENDAMCEKNFNQHNFDCPALNTSVSRSSKTHWIRRIFSRLNKKMKHKTKQCREKCCVACKNPTGKTKKMEYKTNQWHEKCFCCVVCKNPIGTKTFVPRDQEIYCAGCYQDKFTTRCVKCNKIITKDGITYKNEPWHRDCFTCSHCNQSLAGQRFTSRDDKPYCAVCFGELFAKRCTACTNPITGIGVTRFISFEGRHWHNDCFICADCETSLVGRDFITNGHDINCPECAIEKLPRVKGA